MKKYIFLLVFLSLAVFAQDKPPTSGTITLSEEQIRRWSTPDLPPKCPAHGRNDHGHGLGIYQENGKTVFTFCVKEYHETEFRVLEQNGLTLYRNRSER